MWLDAEKRQDELVARLTAGQPNLIGGSHFPKPAGNPDPIGWAISNSGPGEILVDGSGCAVLHFNLPMAYDGSMAPHPVPGQPFTAQGKVNRNPRHFDIEAFKRGLALKGSEGNKSYMYLDDEGNLTVGIGHLIPELQSAQDLDFVTAPEGVVTDAAVKIATPEQIAKAYEQLVTRRAAMGGEFDDKASTYEKYSFILDESGKRIQVRLRASAAEIQVIQDVDAALNQLRRSTTSFPNFDSYPPGAKLALLDMAFNMGTQNLKDEFFASKKVFGPAVKIRNWRLAAEASHRRTPNEHRNTNTKNNLLSAAQQEPFFHDPSCASRRGLGEWSVPNFFG